MVSLRLARIGSVLLHFGLAFAPVAAVHALVPPDANFSVEAVRDGDALNLRWTIAPGTYLYRDSLSARLEGRDAAIEVPPGETKEDPTFGLVQVFHGAAEARLAHAPPTGILEVAYQGCADRGVCFPPERRSVDLVTLVVGEARIALPELAGDNNPPAAAEAASIATAGGDAAIDAPSVAAAAADGDPITAVLGGNPLVAVGTFFGFGLLLSLTPCIFPMIPILAAVLAGSPAPPSAGRGFLLSSAYVVAMAAAYGAVGFAAGWSGQNLQAALQTPWALGGAAAVFVLLAIAMFGALDLSVPARFAARLTGGSRGGSLAGAAVLGFGSALIVGPCVTPPLAAAMLHAVQTGDAATGAATLFALGLGMGLPLVAVGTFGARVLPKSGRWLGQVRPAFGAIFLMIALLLVTRLLPPSQGLALWGAFAIGLGAFLGGFDRLAATSGWSPRLGKAAGLVAALYGAMLIIGAAGGASDALRPLAFLTAPPLALARSEPVEVVDTPAAFDDAFAGVAGDRPVMVKFSADWCTVCKSNEAVLADAAIRERVAAMPAVVVDITDYDDETRALLSRFSVAGPPTLFLLDAAGREIPGSRLVGPITVADVEARLGRAGL